MLTQRYENLLSMLKQTGGAAIAFSGGVDSTFLLHAAKEALSERVLAVSVATPYVPRWEQDEARELARNMGVSHAVAELPFPEEIRMNPADHCYTCKSILFTKLWEMARANGYAHLFDGTNVDDLGDYRPGLKALKELEVTSPLMEAGLTKADIRELSREFGLPTWDKPSFACLLSRMPIGVQVKESELEKVEQAEVFLMENGFPAVRVRHHGDVARIEVPQDQIIDLVSANVFLNIDTKLKQLGFKHVAVDLHGYSMGSLNRPTE